MRVAIAQLNCIIGDIEGNTRKVISVIREFSGKCDFIVFPELIITGYPPEDILFWNNYHARIEKAIREIRDSVTETPVIVGIPYRDEKNQWFNSAILFYEGKIFHVFKKMLLPDYGVFYESRYFESGYPSSCNVKGIKTAVLICEDIWEGVEKTYHRNPLELLKEDRPDILFIISASPFSRNHFERRLMAVKKTASLLGVNCVYVNQVGAHTEIVFDGGSFVMTPEGNLTHLLPFFTETVQILDIQKKEELRFTLPEVIERITGALLLGITDFVRKLNINGVKVALSGGIDSAVVSVLTHLTIKDKLELVFMPSKYTTRQSFEDARKVASNLQIKLTEIHIDEIYEKALRVIEKEIPGTITVAMENMQARIRNLIISYLSNRDNTVFFNTSNKSELATGYGTLYGDISGALAVIGDVYKTEVYEIARYLNKKYNFNVIPQSVFEKAPSAELKPGQKDEDTLPPYPILDKILYYYIEERETADTIVARGFDRSTVLNVIRMIEKSEFKRYQGPPPIRVSRVAWGKGWKMPLIGKFP